jgi:hypothetical protein
MYTSNTECTEVIQNVQNGKTLIHKEVGNT